MSLQTQEIKNKYIHGETGGTVIPDIKMYNDDEMKGTQGIKKLFS
jgi:hypothetical protein